MNPEEKLTNMDLAARIVGFRFDKRDLDLLISIYDGVSTKGGDFSLKDAAAITAAVEERHQNRNDLTQYSKPIE